MQNSMPRCFSVLGSVQGVTIQLQGCFVWSLGGHSLTQVRGVHTQVSMMLCSVDMTQISLLL